MQSSIRRLTMLSIALVPMSLRAGSPPEADVAYFEKNVRPLLVSRCFECHAGEESSGGLRVDSRDAIRTGGDSGPAVVPEDLQASLLIKAVRYKDPDLQMPPKGALDENEISVLEHWVKIGAPDPRSVAPSAASGPTGMSIEEGRHFWSLRPIQDPAVPAGNDQARTPIDSFIIATLQRQGLKQAPPAGKRALLRRVTLDVTGLPPTPDEVRRFLADESPDAFEREVDRLLSSPSYGVRWGRHWLDVARYADSNGLDENLAFGNAWRYRDYIVDSFNQDKRFDRLVQEQLAGDLLPDASDETRTATGFLVLGAKVLAEPDREKLAMDTIDEQLDTIGKAFWGMTIGCVRCHDHKFDPLKQTDYYGLAAIMKSTKTFGDTNTGAIKHWNEYSFASDEEKATLKTVEAEIAKLKSAATSYKSQAYEKIRAEARSRAADYLVAAATIKPDATLTEIEAIAGPAGLHSRILFQCRQHLEFHRNDPLFAVWHEKASTGDVEGIEIYYRGLFDAMNAALAEAKTEEGKIPPLADSQLQAAREAINDPSGLLAVPPKPEFALDPETLAEFHRLSEEARLYESAAPDEPAAMAVSDGAILVSLPIHIRGSHLNLGEPVARNFPAVMRQTGDPPSLSPESSGRLELATWATSSDHPLTARVYVNRIWRWHFGEGIVRSADNFGKLGDKPTHPELLDWLASRLMEEGWSTKSIHRMILSSTTYRMDSDYPELAAGDAIDTENKYLWKFPRQRFDAEQIRDSIHQIAGRLDASIGGKTVPLRNRQFVFDHTSIDHTRYDSRRRAIYLPVVRNNLYSLFEQFDFPDPTMPTGDRHSTVVASQALLLMNADWVMDCAEDLARNICRETSDPRARVEQAFERVLSRPPSDEEIDRTLRYIQSGTSENDRDDSIVAWTRFCHVLFASNEFIDVR